MLKHLEILGFKSFADKTEFPFSQGLTAIVGPNGSGKSNVVDAIRWMLGEQSAKSLRGGEMTDVIFNGSSTRRSLGLAEVSLTLNNSRKHYALDSAEITLTRRVYRDGQGEYLINRQPARLKDIKDLFLGSGADAYAVIAQGRVDELLHSSAKDRRLIFEEASGISRFKARKHETLRKLENVESNLSQVRLVLEELQRQLQGVRLQASKAQRFQEYQGELQRKRLALSLQECHEHSTHLKQVDLELAQQRGILAEQMQHASVHEAAMHNAEQKLAAHEQEARVQEAILADVREKLAMQESTLHHARSQATTLEQEKADVSARLQALQQNWQALQETLQQLAAELKTVAADGFARQETVAQLEYELTDVQRKLSEGRKRLQEGKGQFLERMRQQSHLHNERVSLNAQVQSIRQQRARLSHRQDQANQSLSQLDLEVRSLEEAEQATQQKLSAAKQKLEQQRRDQEQLRQQMEEAGKKLLADREERSALGSRIDVLTALDQSREGLSAGVREVLELAGKPNAGSWQGILGLVADVLSVSHEYAPLIDLALGERSQYVLVRDAETVTTALQHLAQPLSGRVTLLPLNSLNATRSESSATGRGNRLFETGLATPSSSPPLQGGAGGIFRLPDHPGLIAPASRLVACAHAELAGLADFLLGQTLVVRDLTTARALSRSHPQWRYITLKGELLEPNGAVTIGTHRAETGVISRKSELRELREQARLLDDRLRQEEDSLAEQRNRLAHLELHESQSEQTIQVLMEQAVDLRSRLNQQRERSEGLAQEVENGRVEIRQLDEELARLETDQNGFEAKAQEADQQVKQLQADLDTLETNLTVWEQQRHKAQEALTAAKVALATAEERRTAVVRRHQQAEEAFRERSQELQDHERHLAEIAARLMEAQHTAATVSGELDKNRIVKETAETALCALAANIEALRQQRQELQAKGQAVRESWQELQNRIHGQELKASELRHLLTTLATRLKEEQETDLLELYKTFVPPETPLEVAKVQEEINDLRKKISRLGSVSLDSLQELAVLEERVSKLQTQHDDLVTAKKSLDEIIAKINSDSRELFTATFESVRRHFQEIFRKLFGGGMADIILEDTNDVLECGIEITAQPPGKEMRSLMLLSGGEKALTAVALLLAIFRNKPSPFCILDEVDAPLDEANVGRFAAVLREFLDLSQFIIISHSKKTMACADVLYGITMQEPGISKRVAVRFEDWTEDRQESVAQAA
jgi:chromosome segregation protein